MKLFILLIIFFTCSQNVFAYPQVKDYVRYEAPYKDSKIIIEKTVKESDPERQRFLVYTLITFKGTILDEKEFVTPRSSMFNKQKIENILKTCHSRGGARWHIILQGQTIQTCTYYNEDAQMDQIVGDVPFGQIRFQIYLGNAEFLDFNLTQFKTTPLKI